MKLKRTATLVSLRGLSDEMFRTVSGYGVLGPMKWEARFVTSDGNTIELDVTPEQSEELAKQFSVHSRGDQVVWDITLEENPHGRPIWDEIWMDLAESLSQRSTCKRSSVGCVVVSEDNSVVLGIGYNGGPKGQNNECLSDEPGKCGHLHAEINALIKTNYRDAAKKKVYVTVEPCYPCAVALVNADVKEVIYGREYRLHDGLELLKRAGIAVRQYPRVGKDP